MGGRGSHSLNTIHQNRSFRMSGRLRNREKMRRMFTEALKNPDYEARQADISPQQLRLIKDDIRQTIKTENQRTFLNALFGFAVVSIIIITAVYLVVIF